MPNDPVPCVLCADRGVRREGVAVPVMVIPVKNWPGTPAYAQFRGAVCQAHRLAFSMNTFSDYNGAWYDMIADDLRAVRKPAVNPFPNDSSFKWEEFIVNPNFEPAEMSACYLEFWHPKTLAAKGASKEMGSV